MLKYDMEIFFLYIKTCPFVTNKIPNKVCLKAITKYNFKIPRYLLLLTCQDWNLKLCLF